MPEQMHCTALQQPKHRPSIPSVFSAQPPASSPGSTGNNPGRPKHPCSQNQKLGNTAYHIKTGRSGVQWTILKFKLHVKDSGRRGNNYIAYRPGSKE
ncbi:mitochondrial 2-oxodicarboxylate [Histoplasma ohiense]|nr:mitochondrial 2-oxodicarboxylate [Histoplasma ohiense (nom. inval.)]